MIQDKIEINKEFKQALDLIEKSRDCVFITGNAGTGKTTFLHYYITRTHKKTVVLAPTGVAALNCGGETVHSFFHFKTDITLSKIKKKNLSEKSIYKRVETIVIDEVSILRCDLLDCIDKFLRLNRQKPQESFGGVQIVFIGDLRQLPPVVKKEEYSIFNSIYKSPYFLSAYSLQDCVLHTVELKKVYRQQDYNFITLLNSVRNGTADDEDLLKLNSRVGKTALDRGVSICLTTTNKKATLINHKYLSQIKTEKAIFSAQTENIDENSKNMPADWELVIKKGAQVMMLNNDIKDRWVNGSVGIVEDICNSSSSDKTLIYVKFQNGRTEAVEPFKWELFKYKWNEQQQQIETERAGFFKQYPLKLSWAVTIHKSQGKTFDNVVIDMEYGAFAPGQLYVALSRCKSLEGISFLRPLTKRDILVSQKFY
ncbi:MAG: AAA family ATPase [Endomicrobium sp.]|jgi:ATP-dependent exoDNAse (exonuclease V) alpha subunit|uniref:ATP-dependent DNA helicase n=1 Tax=Candidatus Endomicrobiellum cubanum TaxID=3242325 RepID=UPI002839527E|nr:AAA family ATPase [Endomicrobium sp.]